MRSGCVVAVHAAQRAALRRFYAAAGGPLWHNRSGLWSVDGGDSGRQAWNAGTGCAASTADASFCSSHGITCVATPRCPAAADGSSSGALCSQPQCNAAMCLASEANLSGSSPSNSSCGCGTNATTYVVSEIDLSRNGLATEHFDVALAALAPLNCSLRSLQLQHNDLSGSIGEGVSVFQNLRTLSLGTNMLSGAIPVGLSALRNLSHLDLSNNRLIGAVPSGLCQGALGSTLVDLILSSNRLNGTFSAPGCSSLVNLDFAYNRFSALGDFSGLDSLRILRFNFNQLRGPIPSSLRDARSLVSLQGGVGNPIVGVGLTGTLPEFVTRMSQLVRLDLSGNNLSGTIPDTFDALGSLIALNLEENYFTGTVPSIGTARSGTLSTLYFSKNYLHGTIPESGRMAQLTGSPEYTVDLSNNYLHCCGTIWNGSVGLMSYEAVNHSAPRLPSYLRQSSIRQFVAPDRETKLGLAKESQAWGAMRCPLLMASSAPAYPSSSLPYLEDVLNWNVNPRYYMYENCTCAQGFQLTTVDNPLIRVVPVMACTPIPPPSWLSRHLWLVAIILVVALSLLAWVFCFHRHTRPALVQAVVNLRKRVRGEPSSGTVSVVNTDIEGYSDLMQRAPDAMQKALVLHNSVIREARFASYGYTVAQEGDSYSLCFHESFDAVAFCLMTQQLLLRQPWPEGLCPPPARWAHRKKTASQIVSSVFTSTQLLWRRASDLSRLSSLFASRWSWSFANTRRTEGRGCSAATAPPAPPKLPRTAHADVAGSPSGAPLPPPPGAASADSVPPSETEPLEVRLSIGSGDSADAPESSSPSQQRLFHGLRVRMGVATGPLQEGTLLQGSAVLDLAKVIADAGAGGQVLMDDATFKGVKERLEELAAVDHTGLNAKKLHQWSRMWWKFWRPVPPLAAQGRALAFDMGRFVFSADASPNSSDSSSIHTSHSSKAEPSLRLFQIVAPLLVARAKVFGNMLALQEEWVCVDPPYFTAPGAMEAPLTVTEMAQAAPLPPVTMVFCCVDGGRHFAARSHKQARWVNAQIFSVVRSVLHQVPGSYLCRTDLGELKYVLAFPSPAAAIAWCLATQEALMYAEWPDFVNKYDDFKQQLGPDKELLFRGPRLKMGVCEGRPQCILPDHLGKADYHGACVQQAARFMDAGAHGGQVVCEEALAVKVLRQFAEAPRLRPQQQQQQRPNTLARQPHGFVRVSRPVEQQGHPVPMAAGGSGSGSGSQASQRGPRSSTVSSSGGTRLLSVSEEEEEADEEEAVGQETVHSRGRVQPAQVLRGPEPATSPAQLPSASWTEVEESAGPSVATDPSFFAATGLSSTSMATTVPAGSAQQPAAPPLHPYLAVPDGEPYVSRVEAHCVGSFRFKGSSEPVSMVQIVLSSLAGRRFPADPLRARGVRVLRASGLVASADEVQLPNVAPRCRSAASLAQGVPARAGSVGPALPPALTAARVGTLAPHPTGAERCDSLGQVGA